PVRAAGRRGHRGYNCAASACSAAGCRGRPAVAPAGPLLGRQPPRRPASRPGARLLSPQLLPDHAPALLALADGTVFIGRSIGATIGPAIADDAVAKARATPSMAGLDLAKVVSVREPYEWNQTVWALGQGYGALRDARFHVVAYDFGVKYNILRMLAARGCRIT